MSDLKPRFLKCLVPAALTFLLGGCLGYDGTIQHGYQRDPQAIEQVRAGLSAEQILVLLGTPTTTSTVGGSAWYYFSQTTDHEVAFLEPKVIDQRILAIYFDSKKRVTRVAHYGLEDGRVVDFNDRSTPTVGKDQSFLQNALQNLLKF